MTRSSPRAVGGRRTDERARPLDRLHRTIWAANQHIVRARDRHSLLEGICHILVERGGFRLAWVGPPDLALGPPSPTHLPTGIRSSVALPVVVSDRVVTVLHVAAAAPRAFAPAVRGLLEELAADIGLALAAFDRKEAGEQSERALGESANMLRLSQRVAKVGLWVWDVQADKLTGSEDLFRMFGLGSDAMGEGLAAVIADYVHPDDRGLIAEAARRVLSERTPSGLEFRLVLPDQSVRTVWAEMGEVVFDAAGGIERLTGIVQDLTDRKGSELALQRARDFSESLIETANVIFLQLDTGGVVRRINTAAEEITGYSRAEIEGGNWFELLVPKARYPHVWRAFQGASLHLEIPEIFENPILTKDGRERHVLWKNSLVREGGQVVGTISFGVDITDWRSAKDEQARLSQVVEQTTESIVMTDPQGNIVYVNPAFERVSGYRRDEVLGRNPRLLKSGHQDAAFYRRMWEKLARGEVWTGRLVNRRKDGTLYQETATIGPVRNAAGQVISYVAVKRDVTHETTLERQLLQAQKMEAVGRLAGGVAHDFNNLLGVILGYGNLVLRELEPESRSRARVEQIGKAAERAAALTRQLLAFSRQQVLQPKVLDLNAVFADTEKMLRRLIGEDIELVTAFEPNLGSVMADCGQMEQIIMNLAVNARDAMPEGGRLTLETQNVRLDEDDAQRNPVMPAGRFVMVAVSDEGSGMDAETQSHIFEPFFTTKEPGKGTGLGLSTVYGIVKQSGGYVWVYSEMGKGTTFKIYFPRNDAEAEPAGPVEAVPSILGEETVLLVEDDLSLRDMLSEILEGAGYTVLVASDGRQALKVAGEYPGAIHLVVTDVIMPGMTGPEAAQEVMARRSEVRVLYVSGYSPSGTGKRSMLPPGAAFLGKPFTPRDLLGKVREVLKRP